MSNTTFTQYVLVEFNNGLPGIAKIVSDNKIDYDQVVKYYVEKHDFKPLQDDLTFIDAPETIDLDPFILGFDEEFVTWTDENGVDLDTGTKVRVPEPENENDNWLYPFEGIVIASKNGKVVVKEEWTFEPHIAEVEPKRLDAIG